MPSMLYTYFHNIIKIAANNKNAVDDANNIQVFDTILFKYWQNIRNHALALKLFENNESQEQLFAKLNLQDIAKDIVTCFKNFFVNGSEGKSPLINAYAANDKESKNVNAIEFWIVMQHYISEVQKDNVASKYGDFSTILNMAYIAIDDNSPAADYVALLFKTTVVHVGSSLQNYVTGIEEVEKQIARLKENATHFFSVGNLAKADKIQQALDKALEKYDVQDVRKDPEIRKALSQHRLFSFFRETRSIKNIDNSLNSNNLNKL